jgi:hypothetical protein
MKPMHSLTKPITIFPTILEDQPTLYTSLDFYGINNDDIIMRLKLPTEPLLFRDTYLNIYKSKNYTFNDQPVFYFKIDNNNHLYTFPIPPTTNNTDHTNHHANHKNKCFHLISFILDSLSEFTIYNFTFDLLLTFNNTTEIKQFIKLPLNQITFTQGEIVTI